MLLQTSLSFLIAASLGGQEALAPEPPIALTVEYVGDPDTPRGESFVEFLGEQFTEVQSTDARDVSGAADAAARFADADVLVVDANLTGKLPDGYGKPMIVISGPGVLTAEGLGGKLDWL